MPVPVRVWVVLAELTVVIPLLALPADEWTPTTGELAIAGGLLAAAVLHSVACRAAEERRRALHIAEDGGSIDTSCVSLFAAAVVLPLPLALALLVVVRAQRWTIARKSATRFIFSVCAIGHSQIAAHCAARVLLGTDPLASGGPVAVLVLAAAAALYAAAQTLLIGGVKCWASNRFELRNFGSQAENVTFAAALSAGLLLTLSLHTSIWAPLVLTPATVGVTRLAQHVRQLQRERAQLTVDALHDPLTSLPNRRGFSPRAELAVTTDLAAGACTAVLMADIDHFKNWNTHLGHFGADQALIAVADALRAHTRHKDLLCRWGGEEIAVVLPTTTREEATATAERIRASIEATRITTTLPSGGHQVTLGTGDWPPVTVSIGLALAPDHGADLTTLQEAADHALQLAKDTGRNRVCLADTSSQAAPSSSEKSAHVAA